VAAEVRWHYFFGIVLQPPFLFLLASVIVFIFGPGRFSVDGLLHRRKKS
jgi:putative oxidoreductase